MDEDEQFNQAFGEHTGLDTDTREKINQIKDNANNYTKFHLYSYDVERFTNQAWELLGRYIANNTNLKRFDLDDSGITDRKMALLFRDLAGSVSLERLDLDNNDFGIDGVRSIVHFLQNSPNLSILYLCGNDRINSECFDILVSALHGRPVENLYSYDCSITDISALDRYNLPNLETLCLNHNKIGGREGCITLSNLLQKEGSSLAKLDLDYTGIENDGAKFIAASLKHNTTLKELDLSGNNLTNEAYVAFLELLVDISSIENTYSSNHTLETCNFDRYDDDNTYDEIQSLINNACKENKMSSSLEAVGRAKVIKYQLDSQHRKKLCEVQGIEYSSIGSVFADIEPVLLPKVLSLIGHKNGQSELYTTLIHTAPDLLSYIDRKAMLNEAMAKNTARVASLSEECAQKVAEYEQKIAALKTEMLAETSRLTAENNELKTRRTLIDVGDSRQSTAGEGEGCGSISRGKKRGRS